jgi:DNA-binding CsgD family transcriptional regulator
MEKRYIRKDGTLIWGLLAVSLVRGRDGEPAYFISQISDITAAKDAAAAKCAATAELPEEHRKPSPREAQVLSLLAAGHITTEVAQRLAISEETVQTLVKRAIKKLGAKNRTHAVVRAMKLGWLDETRPTAD